MNKPTLQDVKTLHYFTGVLQCNLGKMFLKIKASTLKDENQAGRMQERMIRMVKYLSGEKHWNIQSRKKMEYEGGYDQEDGLLFVPLRERTRMNVQNQKETNFDSIIWKNSLRISFVRSYSSRNNTIT